MTVDALRTPAEVASATFDAVIAADLEKIVEQAAPDAIDDFVAIGVFKGREAIKAFFRELFAAFPDFLLQVDRIVADDRSAVVQWHAAGTFTGSPFQGIQSTGRRVSVRGVDVMEIKDGLIQRNTIYYDGAAFARQIGLLPSKDSAADKALVGAFNARTRAAKRLGRKR